MRRILIDTNIYVSFKMNDADVVARLRNCDFIGIDITVLGELLTGFRLGRRERKNRAGLRAFLDIPRVRILAHDEETAEHYSSIMGRLRKKRKPLPTNDVWIAASAMRHGLALYSRDRHFDNIPGLARG